MRLVLQWLEGDRRFCKGEEGEGPLSGLDEQIGESAPKIPSIAPGRTDIGNVAAVADPVALPLQGVASGEINPFGTPSRSGVDNPLAVEGVTDTTHRSGAEIAAQIAASSYLGGASSPFGGFPSSGVDASGVATGGDAVAQTGLGEVGSAMPAAVPEADTASQGLTERSPGVFAQPGATGYTGPVGAVPVPATAPKPSSEGVDPGSAPLQAPGAAGATAAPTDAAAADMPGTSAPGLAAPAEAPPPPVSTPAAAPPITSLPAGGGPAGLDATTTGQGPVQPQDPGMVDRVLKSIGIMGKNGGVGANVLPLGLMVGGQMMNKSRGDQTQRDLRDISANSKATSDRLLAEGASGTAPPAIMAQMDRTYQDKVAEINQRYARMGRDPGTDSAAQAEIGRAKEAKDAALANYSQALTTQGLQAAGIAAGPQTQAAMEGAKSDRELQAAMANGLSTLAMMQAMQGNK